MSASSRKYMSKRQRPCDFCRSRKTACRIEGNLPCRLCSLHQRQCTFQEAAQPRKRPTLSTGGDAVTSGQLAHSLDEDETLSAHVSAFQFGGSLPASASPEINDMTTSDFHSTQHRQTLESDETNEQILFGNLADHFFNDFEDTITDEHYSQAYPLGENNLSPNHGLSRSDMQESEQLSEICPAKTLLDTNDDLNPQTLGYSADMDPYLLQQYRYASSSCFEFKQLSIRTVSHGCFPTQFLLSQPGMFSQSREEMGLKHASLGATRERLEALVSSDTGHRLISLFRRFIVPQYPIFSECLFPDPKRSPPYLLATIYMISQPFARFDDVLSIELAYENLDYQALFGLVHDALQFEAHNPDISVVQAMLLLIARPSTSPLILESSFKWSLHGTLVSTAQNLGLHLNPSHWNIASWQISLRRRISATIFSLDKWLAASLGRPPLLQQDDWLVTCLTNEDHYSSSVNPDQWIHCIRYTTLSSVLGDTLHQLFSLRAIHDLASDVEKTLGISRPLLEDLSRWHQEFIEIPTETPTNDSSLPIVCSLGYHYVQMTIFRAIMRPFLEKRSSNGATADITSQLQGGQADITGFARTGVHSATTAASGFVKGLQEKHSQLFWPHWTQVAFSCICFLDLLMAVSSPDVQEALTWFQELRNVRREMRLKSVMLPVLRLGLLRIDAIFWKGIDTVLHLPPHVDEALKASLASSEA